MSANQGMPRFILVVKRVNGGGPNTETVNADQAPYQRALLNSASPNVHQPIAGPRSQNNVSGDAVQVMRDVADQQHQQQLGNGPDTAAQTQGTSRPETAVQTRRQKQKPMTGARAKLKVLKPKLPDPSPANHKNVDNRRFACIFCSKTFHYKHVMQNHTRTHTGEKPYTCGVCQKAFTRDHHVKMHKRLHTGEKPYHCMCCKRMFKQLSNLRRHMKTHVGCTTLNLCDQCGMTFPTVSDLAVHKEKTCCQQSQPPGNNTVTSTSAASSFDGTVGSTSNTDSAAQPSASAFVANRPPVFPWSTSTPAHPQPTLVPENPAPWSTTIYNIPSPWVPDAAGYTLPTVQPDWSQPGYSAPAAPAFLSGYGSSAAPIILYNLPNQVQGFLRPTLVYSSPILSIVHAPQPPQPSMTIMDFSSSSQMATVYGPNGYCEINLQNQNTYAVQQTEPKNISDRSMAVHDEDYDTDDSDRLVIVTDDSD